MSRIGRWVLVGLVVLTGCSSRKSSLLLERQARGPIEEEAEVAKATAWRLEPILQTQTKNQIDVTVNYASPNYLNNFFKNRAIFGVYAGGSPYFPEQFVFYVKIANHGPKKIRITPADFVLIDDRGSQYSTIGVDYITAFADYRHGAATTTRGLLENASPGYFGVSLPVGKIFAAKPQGRFALLQQASLQGGYLYPSVVHDGFIAFWNPSPLTKKLRLLITNIKTEFDANDLPQSSLEFAFDFDASHP